MNKFFPIVFVLLFFSCNEDNSIVTPSNNDIFTPNSFMDDSEQIEVNRTTDVEPTELHLGFPSPNPYN